MFGSPKDSFTQCLTNRPCDQEENDDLSLLGPKGVELARAAPKFDGTLFVLFLKRRRFEFQISNL